MSISEKIKKIVLRWLDMDLIPAIEAFPLIQESASFSLNAMKNRIWYRGDASEIEQFFHMTAKDSVSSTRFWALSPSTPSSGVRKMHSGLPGMIVSTLADIVVTDMLSVDLNETTDLEPVWNTIAEENELKNLIAHAIQEVLVIGDGAFKVSIDTTVSQYPLLEFVGGDRITYVRNRGRLEEVQFHTLYKYKKREYILRERYGKGFVDYELTDKQGNLQSMESMPIPELEGLQRVDFDNSLMLAIPFMIYPSPKWAGRGRSIFDAKSDAFDALDETVSQWQDAVRLGRVKRYIPESMIPRDPETGKMMAVNPMDNVYTALRSSKSEDNESKIITDQPEIQYEGYLGSYVNNLDMCLQGLISPSTLGIDVKKLDNAEAQREKEKATLYTRNKIINVLAEVIPELVGVSINAFSILHGKGISELDVSVEFGEYANPSFEAQIETIGKASSSQIMSIEAQVNSLWGDTKEPQWIEDEIKRIKSERGIMELEEPSVAPHGFRREYEELMLNGMAGLGPSNTDGDGDISLPFIGAKPPEAYAGGGEGAV